VHGAYFATAITVLCWLAVVYKGPATLRHRHEPAARSFWLTLVGIALGLTVLQQPTYGLIDHMLRQPNIARLLGDALALGASWTVQAFLWQLNYADSRGRRPLQAYRLALFAALVAMSVCFLRIPIRQEDIDLLTHHPAAPFVLVYRLVFLAYLAIALINVTRLSWHYAHGAVRPLMRLGLRQVAAGAVLGLLYVGHEALWVLAARLGGPSLSPAQMLPRLLMASGIGLMVFGSTLPSWGPRVGLDALCRWFTAFRSLVRLYPLWPDLCLALPQIALFPPTSPLADRFSLGDVHFRLCRRVVEIRDGLLAVRPVAAASVTADRSRQCVKQRGGAVIAVATEAVGLMTPVWQPDHRMGERPAEALADYPVGAYFAREVAALERLARWYRRPASAQLLQQWLAETGAAEAAAARRQAS